MNQAVSRSIITVGMALITLTMTLTAKSARYLTPPQQGRDPQIGQSFQVPYRLTDTNHILVRVRINGKGPFNFLVDTGAPALFIATDAAKKIGLKPPLDTLWTSIERLELEGGSQLSNLKGQS